MAKKKTAPPDGPSLIDPVLIAILAAILWPDDFSNGRTAEAIRRAHKLIESVPDYLRGKKTSPGQSVESCRSPFRKDKKPSFSIYDRGRRAKDHATGENFDGPSFLAKARDLPIEQALKTFIALALGESTAPACGDASYGKETDECAIKFTQAKPNLSKFWVPTMQEIRAVARDRGLGLAAAAIPKRLGCLKTGNICGHRSWILTDPAGWNAEARRYYVIAALNDFFRKVGFEEFCVEEEEKPHAHRVRRFVAPNA